MLVQFTEKGSGFLGTGINLGKIFDNTKISIDNYQSLINKFKNVINVNDYVKSNNEINWNDLSVLIGNVDNRARSYFETLVQGNGIINNQSASLQGFAEHLNKTGQAYDYAAMKSAALNTLLNVGMGTAISFAVTGLAKLADYLIVTKDEIRETAQNAAANIQSARGSFQSLESTVNNVKNRYAELAQGVNRTSSSIENINLSQSEYEEFLSLGNQLAQLSPSLVSGYDMQGNAILNLGSNYESIINTLDTFIEKQRESANLEIKNNLPDLWTGVATESKDTQKAISSLREKQSALQPFIDNNIFENIKKGLKDGIITIEGDYQTVWDLSEKYRHALQELDVYSETEGLSSLDENSSVNQLKINILDESKNIQSALKSLDILAADYTRAYSNTVQELNDSVSKDNANWSSLKNNILAAISTDSSYKVLSDNMKNSVQSIINNLDWGKLQFDQWEDAENFINNKILSLFTGDNGAQIQQAFENMFNFQSAFQSGEKSVREYQDYLTSFSDQLGDIDNNAKNAILGAFSMVSADGASLDEMITRIKSGITDELDGAVEGLSWDDLQFAYKLVDDGDITWDELLDKIKTAKKAAENTIDINSRANLDAYNAAGETPSHDADYNSYTAMLKQAEEMYKAGEIGDERFKAAARAFSMNGMEDAANFAENISYLGQYFTEGSEGLERFAEKMKTLDYVEWNDELKTYNFNLSDMERIAQDLGMPLEMLSVLLDGLKQYGYSSDYFGSMEDGVAHLTDLYTQLAHEESKLAQMEANGTTGTALDEQRAKVESLKESIETTKSGMEDLLNIDAQSLEDEYKAAQAAAQSIAKQYNSLDKNSDAYDFQKRALEEAAAAIEKKYSIKIELPRDNIKFESSPMTNTATLTVDIQNKDDIALLKEQIDTIPEDMQTHIDFTATNAEQINQVQDLIKDNPNINASITLDSASVNEFASQIQDKTGNMTVILNADGTVTYHIGTQDPAQDSIANVSYEFYNQENPKNKKAPVFYSWGGQDFAKSSTANVNYTLGSQASPLNKTAFVNYIIGSAINGSKLNGTAHSDGTTVPTPDKALRDTWKYHITRQPSGAFIGGNWGLPYDQTALVGELRPEMLVRDGHWQLIGVGGAEFVGLKKGDIIFNHKQTEQLLKNGYVTGRGKPIGFTSHVQGTTSAFDAHAQGSANNNAFSGGTNDDFSEVIDFIAIAIERAANEIDLHRRLADSLFQTYRNQNIELDKAIAQSAEQKKLKQRAYDKYIMQSDASGLSNDYKKLIQNGQLDISAITDENLKKQIDDYQEWYEKALDVRSEIVDISVSIRDMHIQKLENIADDFEKIISYKNSLYSMLENLNDLNALKGIKTTTDDLTKLMSLKVDVLGYYQGQAAALKKEFDRLSSTVIDLNSDDYWEWMEKISDAENDAYKAESAVYELKEQIFELQAVKPLEEFISQLELSQKEMQTLNKLINNNILFDENAGLTNAGLAQLGLYTHQLSDAKKRSAEYAAAIEKLKKNLDNGNLTQEKYNELLKDYSSEQQQAAQDTKDAMDAIVNLRIKGIEKSVDAFKQLINARKEDLRAQKDYRDQENALNKKRDEISAVTAKIKAAEGDASQAQRIKQLNAEKLKLEQEYNEMVEENRYNAEMDAYDQALQQFETNADAETAALQSNLSYRNQIIADSLNLAKENHDEIYTYLTSLSETYGASLQSNVIDQWANAASAARLYEEAIGKIQAQTQIGTQQIQVNSAVPTSPQASNEPYAKNTADNLPVNQSSSSQSPNENTASSSGDIWAGIPKQPSTKGLSKYNRTLGYSIWDRMAWNGYKPGKASQAQLYKNLNGESVMGRYAYTAEQNVWMVNQLKARGFRHGGIVGIDNDMLRRTGEDGIALVKNEDVFLERQDAALIKALIDAVPDLNRMFNTIPSVPVIDSLRNNPVINFENTNEFIVQGSVDKTCIDDIKKFVSDVSDKASDKTIRRLREQSYRPGFGGLGK